MSDARLLSAKELQRYRDAPVWDDDYTPQPVLDHIDTLYDMLTQCHAMRLFEQHSDFGAAVLEQARARSATK